MASISEFVLEGHGGNQMDDNSSGEMNDSGHVNRTPSIEHTVQQPVALDMETHASDSNDSSSDFSSGDDGVSDDLVMVHSLQRMAERPSRAQRMFSLPANKLGLGSVVEQDESAESGSERLSGEHTSLNSDTREPSMEPAKPERRRRLTLESTIRPLPALPDPSEHFLEGSIGMNDTSLYDSQANSPQHSGAMDMSSWMLESLPDLEVSSNAELKEDSVEDQQSQMETCGPVSTHHEEASTQSSQSLVEGLDLVVEPEESFSLFEEPSQRQSLPQQQHSGLSDIDIRAAAGVLHRLLAYAPNWECAAFSDSDRLSAERLLEYAGLTVSEAYIGSSIRARSSSKADQTELDEAKLKKAQALMRGWMARRRMRQMIGQAFAASDAKMNRLRSSAIKELLQSERTYVADLRVLVHVFKMNICAAQESGRVRFGPGTGVDSIMPVVSDLLQMHEDFLEGLNSAFRDISTANTDISSVVASFAPRFAIYKLFVSGFDRSQQILASLMRNNKPFVKLLAQCEDQIRSTTSGSHSLASFLIRPIQRLPRYRLLLQEVLKHTAKDRKDHTALEKALDVILQLNDSVNAKQAEASARDRVIEVSKLLDGLPDSDHLVQPARLVIAEGDFEFSDDGGEEWNNKHLILFSDILLVTSISAKKTALGNRLKFVAWVLLKQLTEPYINEDARKITVDFRKATFDSLAIKFNSASELTTWGNHMSKVCLAKEVSQSTDNNVENVRVGWLDKQSGGSLKQWQKRWCVLKGNWLLYYKSPNSKRPQGQVDLLDRSLVLTGISTSRPYGIKLEPEEGNGRVFTFSAPDRQTQEEWGAALSNACGI